jgi:hypothetical protein
VIYIIGEEPEETLRGEVFTQGDDDEYGILQK